MNVSPYDVLTMIMTVQDLVGETGMSTDAAMLVGLMIFVGGLVFWVLLFCAAITGVFKALRSAVRLVVDWNGTGRRREPHGRV